MKHIIIIIISLVFTGCSIPKVNSKKSDTVSSYYVLPRNIEFMTAANGGVLEYCQEILYSEDYVKKSHFVSSSEYFSFKTYSESFEEYYYYNDDSILFKHILKELMLKEICVDDFGFSRIVGIYNTDIIMVDRNYQIQLNGVNYGVDSILSNHILHGIDVPIQIMENWSYDLYRDEFDFKIAPTR